MKIEKIKIENFRGILDAELEFDKQLNVFIGGNGAGKTTVLEAIAKSFYPLISRLIEKSSYLRPNSFDLNYEKRYLRINTLLKVKKNKESVSLISNFGKSKIEYISDLEFTKSLTGVNFLVKQLKNKRIDSLPVLKFYSSKKSQVIFYEKESKINYYAQLESWSNFIHNNLSYSRFLKWFFDNETYELRLVREKNNLDAKNPKLSQLRKAVRKAFKILFNQNLTIVSDQIQRTGNNELIPCIKLKNLDTGETELLDNKSDGEKAIITLIADIAYNLSIAKDFSEGDDYLNSPGIVLIDEIEAHLHPTWQRKIIPLLTELFPNIQFFVTTHSPQVIASVNSQNIFVCEDFKFSKINLRTKGLDSNSILEHIFNATERPKKYVDLIEKFDNELENDGSIEKLEAIIAEIQELDKEDTGQDIDLLVSDLRLQLEAYKFELENETYS